VPSELEPRIGFIRDMADRGVRFIGGMGMGMPIVTFDSVACSAQVYARLLGFDPWRAVRTITSDAAEALGLAQTVGSIRPGLVADLVALEGDPIEDLSALRSVRDVIQAGRLVVRDGRSLV
jgi:imidazolonepropionase-like amidohydrolase